MNNFIPFLKNKINFHRSSSKKSRRVNSLDSFFKENSFLNFSPSKSLDLGCGAIVKNPFSAIEVFGVDMREDLDNNVLKSNLIIDDLPFQNNSLNCCTAFDVLEHIPRQIVIDGELKFPFINLMNEVSRVLKKDGLFFHTTPAYPSKFAFQDPTHVNVITEDTFPIYFCTSSYNKWLSSNKPAAKMYGFTGDFELVDSAWWCGDNCLAQLLKVKK